MDSSRICSADIYKTLWKCRDFELSTLWQRSAMLGVFMIASYTGYGAWMLHVTGSGSNVTWEARHIVSLFICWFGIACASLWVMMMKGSKAWYERYEATICAFAERDESDAFESDRVKDDAGFGICWHKETDKRIPEIDYSLFSVNAGGFSPSKVAILIGMVSLVGWLLLMVIHIMAIFFGHGHCLYLVKNYAFEMAILLSWGCGAFGCGIWKLSKSSTL